MKIDQLVRKNIIDLKPFSSARAEFKGRADTLLDANENPYNSNYNRYPDPYQSKLKSAIAKWRGIKESNIFLGNGSDEIIDIIVRTFCEPKIDRIRYMYPSFGMYEVVADINDVIKYPVDLDESFSLSVEQVMAECNTHDKVLFLCSPNNPTGNSLDREVLIDIIKRFRGIVVVDEAYIDFSEEDSLIDVLDQFNNLIVLQTFSKALGAAGLRIGMAFSNPDILQYLNKVKPPYNIGSQTQANALNVLENISDLNEQIKQLIEQKKGLAERLDLLSCVDYVFPSDANFLLVRFKNDCIDIMNYLKDDGIIVRNRSNLSGCLNCLRITIGTKNENDLLIKALELYK